MSQIIIENVCKKYKNVEALKNVSLSGMYIQIDIISLQADSPCNYFMCQ